MITLYRFPLSHFSEKGRCLLAYKRLEHRTVELKLGLPQLELMRLSGQRKVPVIDHDGTVVADSTEIALYLERTFPDARPLLPSDESRRRDVLALEDRLDRAFGYAAPIVWFASILDDAEQLRRALTVEVYGVGPRSAVVLGRVIAGSARLPRVKRLVERAAVRTRRMLGELCDRLATTKYLVGDEPSLADVAAVGLTMHLKFPDRFLLPEFAGRGVSGFADEPDFTRFFDYRDRFYAEHLS